MNIINVISNPKFFPTLMIGLSICAAIVYAINDPSDWRKIGYFISGACITICVVY